MKTVAFVQNRDNLGDDETAIDGELIFDHELNLDTVSEIRNIMINSKDYQKAKINNQDKEFLVKLKEEKATIVKKIHPVNDSANRKRFYTVFWQNGTELQLIKKTANAIGATNFNNSTSEINTSKKRIAVGISILIGAIAFYIIMRK